MSNNHGLSMGKWCSHLATSFIWIVAHIMSYNTHKHAAYTVIRWFSKKSTSQNHCWIFFCDCFKILCSLIQNMLINLIKVMMKSGIFFQSTKTDYERERERERERNAKQNMKNYLHILCFLSWVLHFFPSCFSFSFILSFVSFVLCLYVCIFLSFLFSFQSIILCYFPFYFFLILLVCLFLSFLYPLSSFVLHPLSPSFLTCFLSFLFTPNFFSLFVFSFFIIISFFPSFFPSLLLCLTTSYLYILLLISHSLFSVPFFPSCFFPIHIYVFISCLFNCGAISSSRTSYRWHHKKKGEDRCIGSGEQL